MAAIPSRWTAYLNLRVPIDDGYRHYDAEGLQDLTRRLFGAEPTPFTLPAPVGPAEIESGVHAASMTAAATVPTDWGVVSLSRTGDRFDRHDYRRAVFLIDQPGANPDLVATVTEAVDAIDAFVEEGRNVVVHCHGGHSRTGFILRAWLMRRHGWDEPKARAFLAERWPHLALWQDEFTDFLQGAWTEKCPTQPIR
jgi:ADP-ribosyl-[dinitrogen reductase] hydrolase